VLWVKLKVDLSFWLTCSQRSAKSLVADVISLGKLLVYLKQNLCIWFVTDFSDVMSDSTGIHPDTYIWAKFA